MPIKIIEIKHYREKIHMNLDICIRFPGDGVYFETDDANTCILNPGYSHIYFWDVLYIHKSPLHPFLD
jgi:hypothetical protein